MPRMKTKIKLKNNSIKHKVAAIVIALLFAGIGSYFVFQSQAAQYDTNKHNDCSHPACPSNTDWFKDKVTQIAPKKIRIDIIVDLSQPMFANPSGKVTFQVIHGARWYGDSTDWRTYSHDLSNISKCVTVDHLLGRSNAIVHSYTAAVPGDAKNHIGTEYDIWMYTTTTGCPWTGGTIVDSLAQPGSNVWGHDVVALSTANPNNNTTGDGGDGVGTNGSGTGKIGVGGGSSGGSTAKTQEDKPNNVPAASSQGGADQPDLDPSPFFDGKEYKAGSVSDSAFGGLFARNGESGVATAGRLVLAFLLIVAIAGCGYFWWHKRIKKS